MPTALIVEDDPYQRLLYREELTYAGYDVLEASGGQEAICIVEETEVDVVVLDIAMPGTDGIETLSRILAIDNKIPVILNTAYSSYKDNFMTWAADAYVVKSSNLTALKQQIAEVLQKRGIEPAKPTEAEN